ncbi:MAG: HPF/RaiA family ribosome-associated protein [Acidobacteriota bacterium]|nr:HPF/RaiA family ribosome-associated protein [Acidobacteriota bacterium]
MDVEFTARQVHLSKALRTQAQEGMERIGRILGKAARASITLREQRHLKIAEITLKARTQTLVGEAKAERFESALRQAIAHVELQAQRYRDRHAQRKRLPKEEKVFAAPPMGRPKTRAAEPTNAAASGNGARPVKAKTAIAVHSFPVRSAVVEPHVVRSGESIALRPMTMEEAVKDAEFRDRDLLIFRNPEGELYVLHRRRDGQMELVEVP